MSQTDWEWKLVEMNKMWNMKHETCGYNFTLYGRFDLIPNAVGTHILLVIIILTK